MRDALPPSTYYGFSADDIEKRRREWYEFVHDEQMRDAIASAGFFELTYANGTEATTARVRLEMRELQKDHKADKDNWAESDACGAIQS